MIISKHGYIVGGAHHKGVQYRAANQDAGNSAFARYITEGLVKIEHKSGKVRVKIKRGGLPAVVFSGRGELGKLRMHHMLCDMERQGWIPEEEFRERHRDLYSNLVNVFKN